MTDTPASLGTERLNLPRSNAQVMAFNNQQIEAPLFSDALEAEVIELAAHRSEEASTGSTA